MEQFIDKVRTLIKQRQEIQRNRPWLTFRDPQEWLEALIREVQEVRDELKPHNQIHLEDELGDIFRNYMSLLSVLENQWYISDTKKVLEKSYEKFHERVSAVIDATDKESSDRARDEIKKTQKLRLEKQHRDLYPS